MLFKDRVLHIVAQIPRGKVLTYKQVAKKAGSPGAYRAVGNLMGQNYDPTVPCHRVIKSDGTPGGYRGGTKEKIERLTSEGFIFAK